MTGVQTCALPIYQIYRALFHILPYPAHTQVLTSSYSSFEIYHLLWARERQVRAERKSHLVKLMLAGKAVLSTYPPPHPTPAQTLHTLWPSAGLRLVQLGKIGRAGWLCSTGYRAAWRRELGVLRVLQQHPLLTAREFNMI